MWLSFTRMIFPKSCVSVLYAKSWAYNNVSLIVSYILTRPLSLSINLNSVLALSNCVEDWSNVVTFSKSPPREVIANVFPSKSNLKPKRVFGCLSLGRMVCLYENVVPLCQIKRDYLHNLLLSPQIFYLVFFQSKLKFQMI